MLEGRVAIVTDGNAGIGAAITDCLVKAGAKVVVMARSRGKYDKLMAEKKWSEQNVHFVPIDLNNADDIKKAANAANDRACGCADILVNNAGVATIAPAVEESVDSWDTTMNVNMRAPFIMG